MRKFVSMFMALVMVFTMGPSVVVKAEDECVGDECRLGPDASNTVNSTNSTGWAWCKENPKDCATYLGETAWNKTKQFGGKAKDGIVDVADVIRNHNYTQTWEDIKNYNYTQGFEAAKENAKWVYEKTLNGTTWLGSEISDVWGNTVGPWFSEKADEAVKFEKQVEDFYNYDLNEQPKWTFWTLLTTAGVGVLTMGTWAFNLFTCCGCCGKCPRCRIRIS